MALTALAVAMPTGAARGQGVLVPSEDRREEWREQRGAQDAFAPVMHSGIGWNLPGDGTVAVNTFGLPDRPGPEGAAADPAGIPPAPNHRLRPFAEMPSASSGADRGARRFRYRGASTRGAFRADTPQGGCEGGEPGGFAAFRCSGSSTLADRGARIHRGGFERGWQGAVERAWDLGAANVLTVGGAMARTRRVFEEAHGLSASGAAMERPAGPAFARDTDLVLSSGMPGAFRHKQKVTALFASTRLTLGGITLSPGLRYERTRWRIADLVPAEGTGAAAAGTGVRWRRTSTLMLPSLVAATQPSARTALRLRWIREPGRAELLALSPGVGVEERDGAGTRLWLGNPDLRIARSSSVDVTGSWRHDDAGTLNLTAFAHMVEDPIVASIGAASPGMAGSASRGMEIRAVNARRGSELGVEAKYRRDLSFVATVLSGFRVELEAGYARARIVPEAGAAARSFRPRLRYGAALAWQRGTMTGSLAWTATDAALLAIDGSSTRAGAQRRLDARTQLAIRRNCDVFLEGQNLADAPTLQFHDSLRHWSIENERYGRTVLAGIRARF